MTHWPLTDETLVEAPSTSANPDQLTDPANVVPSLPARGGAELRNIGRCEDMYLRNAARALATVDALC
jgi:hypothetical protein